MNIGVLDSSIPAYEMFILSHVSLIYLPPYYSCACTHHPVRGCLDPPPKAKGVRCAVRCWLAPAAYGWHCLQKGPYTLPYTLLGGGGGGGGSFFRELPHGPDG